VIHGCVMSSSEAGLSTGSLTRQILKKSYMLLDHLLSSRGGGPKVRMLRHT
jgi:hypothetical protein